MNIYTSMDTNVYMNVFDDFDLRSKFMLVTPFLCECEPKSMKPTVFFVPCVMYLNYLSINAAKILS
jgi:hypothetical protein